MVLVKTQGMPVIDATEDVHPVWEIDSNGDVSVSGRVVGAIPLDDLEWMSGADEANYVYFLLEQAGLV